MVGSIKRPNGERGSLFHGDWIAQRSLCETEQKARRASSTRHVVADIALVARFLGRGLVFDPLDTAFSLYETGWDGWFTDVGGAQFGVCLEFTERGRCEGERL